MNIGLFFETRVVSMGSTRKLGQSPILNQRVLVLSAGIPNGKPVLDVPLTSSHELCSHAISDTVGLCFTYFWKGSRAYTIFGSNAGALVTTPKHKLDS